MSVINSSSSVMMNASQQPSRRDFSYVTREDRMTHSGSNLASLLGWFLRFIQFRFLFAFQSFQTFIFLLTQDLLFLNLLPYCIGRTARESLRRFALKIHTTTPQVAQRRCLTFGSSARIIGTLSFAFDEELVSHDSPEPKSWSSAC